MEFESAATPMPAAAPAAMPQSGGGDGAGFTVDFGDDSSDDSSATEADLNEPDFDFSDNSAPVSLEKHEPAFAPTPAPTPVAPSNSARITLRRGGALTNESFSFGSGAIVGRFDPDSGPVDVDLAPLPEASYVSRHHAEFRHDAGSGQWFVKDMGSSNGTFWRAGGAGAFSRLAGEQEINAGDEISLGNARFEFGTD